MRNLTACGLPLRMKGRGLNTTLCGLKVMNSKCIQMSYSYSNVIIACVETTPNRKIRADISNAHTSHIIL